MEHLGITDSLDINLLITLFKISVCFLPHELQKLKSLYIMYFDALFFGIWDAA